MSLLLEALKRAEEDSRKRKLETVAVTAFAPTASPAKSLATAKREAPRAELMLEQQTPAPPPAQAPEAASAKPAPEPVPMPAPIAATHRQAILAASVMAGTPQRKTSGTQQRRQWLLVTVTLVVALPVAAFLLFGDALLGSSNTPVAAKAPGTLALLPASPSVSLPDVPAVGSSAPAAAPQTPILTAPPPAVPAVTPVAAQEAPHPVAAKVAAPRARVAADTSSPALTRRPVPADNANQNAAAAAAVAASSQSLSVVASAAKPASLMESAYAAYQAGKPGEATQLYREVLKADPAQRDAWLGLAVIAHASNQRESAMDAYKQVLRLEPQNATALAGASSLSSPAGEPRQESRLRELLARSPQEADLNHALGLVLSGEQRWSEAQPLFFKAHALAPEDPQFAYNLAVTLDHLRKSSLAVQYYETALRLAQGKAAAFDESSARSRLAALKAGSPQRTLR
nr:tetratricopeptide repeat protein [Rhodoferax sp.]